MILKTEKFFTKEELVNFVNKNKIEQIQIQQIIMVENNHFVIFYWVNDNKTLNG